MLIARETHDSEDPRELPYRITYSPETGEVFVIMIGNGVGVSMVFLNVNSANRFVYEFQKTLYNVSSKAMKEAEDILDQHLTS